MKELILRSLADGTSLIATHSALIVRLSPKANPEGRLSEITETELRLELEQLVEQGVLEQGDGEWRADWSNLLDACDDDFAAFLQDIGDPNPYLLHVDGSAALATRDFSFLTTWKSNQLSVAVERFGMFLHVLASDRVVRLDTQLLRLLLTMDAFNALDSDLRIPERMFESLAGVHELAGDAPVYLADVLRGSRVVIADQIGLEVEIEQDGSVSFLPRCEGVDPKALQERFRRTVGRRSVYSVKDEDNRTIRVVFGPRQLDVLDRMKSVSHLSGPDAERVRSQPEAVFEGLLDVVNLQFWERVIGIGALPPVSKPKGEDSASGFLDGPSDESSPTAKTDAKDEEPPSGSHEDGRESTTGSGAYLQISTNEEVPWSLPDSQRVPDAAAARLPHAFKGTLKDHQSEAVQWLNHSRSLPRRRGVLLADDMGLGKTLQVLVHLAGLIERTRLDEQLSPATGQLQWRPILLVVPLILVENETWQADMRKFFKADGDVFGPIHVLHGKGIDAVRAQAGRDIAIGTAALSAERLMSYRVVMTNYETVVNYQMSLAQLRDGKPLWSAIVTDEAQAYKDPKTRLSHALKAISADFLIASTGTPVENRLLDLWNIMDAVQPSLLGTAQAFAARYERTDGEESQREAMTGLRSQLRYGKPDAWVLRRTKNQLLGGTLPSKQVVRLSCPMSSSEVDKHESLLAGLRQMSGKGQHLKVLQGLVKLYQHPMGDAIRNASVSDLLASSGKLRAVMAQLAEIKKTGEKVLIFARLRDVQSMLAKVIESELDVHAPIINGDTSSGRGRAGSSASTARAKQSRKSILKDFQNAPGFGVCILSPFVAGTGLTITAANHVIHYGRWWNPAIEAQATDRVYRIGQELPVTVYLPISRDHSGRLKKSFDELLDELLVRKSDLAEFLMPTSREEEFGRELTEELLQNHTLDHTPPAISLEDLRALGPMAFEAVLAELYARDGYDVCLTPQSGDGGADLIARRDGELLLVQAKFSQVDARMEESAFQDLVAASDHFGNIAQHRSVRLVLATNARFSRAVIDVGESDGFELLGPERLSSWLQTAQISHGDVMARETTRQRSLQTTEQWLRGTP